MDTALLVLALTLDNPTVNDLQRADLVFSVELKNSLPQPIEVYPGLAQLSAAAGWGGPSWTFIIEAEGGTVAPGKLRELRSRYGPPGQPPNASYFDKSRVKIAPGTSRRHEIRACFLPRAALPASELARLTLDPDGMDGVTEAEIANRSVLVFNTTCGELARREKGELLRPGIMAFVPEHGALRIRLQYRQEPWLDFHPARSLLAESKAVALRIEASAPR